MIVVKEGAQSDLADPPAAGGTRKLILEHTPGYQEARPTSLFPHVGRLNIAAGISFDILHLDEDIGIEMQGSAHTRCRMFHEIDPALTSGVNAAHTIIDYHVLVQTIGQQSKAFFASIDRTSINGATVAIEDIGNLHAVEQERQALFCRGICMVLLFLCHALASISLLCLHLPFEEGYPNLTM